jgi:hypothetical protein
MNQWKLIIHLLERFGYPEDVIKKAKVIENIIKKHRLTWNTPEYHFFFKQNRFNLNSFSKKDILRIINEEDFSTPCYVYQHCRICPLRNKKNKDPCHPCIDELMDAIRAT